MKYLWTISFLACSLFMTAGIVLVAESLGETPIALAAVASPQDNGTNLSAGSVAGKWELSWTAANGAQRQASMEIKQDGSKLSGKFQGERGSAGLTGSLDGSQVSFRVSLPRRQVSFTGTLDGGRMSGTTEQGAPWTATRPQ